MPEEQVKISALTTAASAAETDIIPIVTDVGTTPVTKNVTVKNLMNSRELFSIVPAGNFSLTAGTGAQAAFPTGGDVFTLLGSSTYLFEGQYFITKSGTTGTTAMAFLLGGGASVTSIHYIAEAANLAANTTGATVGVVWVDQVTSTVINATATTALFIKFRGMIRTNAAGTVTPQIAFSAAPTSPVMVADSFIKFTYIGTSTDNTLGAVA